MVNPEGGEASSAEQRYRERISDCTRLSCQCIKTSSFREVLLSWSASAMLHLELKKQNILFFVRSLIF
ncbi:uncharacterized protein ARMOST_14211 [Armillaria ostoyae]|uniref:Uncharacterized protein n=1 Tax=Armillaria ostoyae TaxID=47428 RepID=A0A284RPX7_ARMOS|nr:uncharacterized protein ARMOST_14211 [Armillaria ostoyae]